MPTSCPTPQSNTLDVARWAWIRVTATDQEFGALTVLPELSLTLGEWYTAASHLIAAWSLERAIITDVPGLTFSVMKVLSNWNLSARLKLPSVAVWHVAEVFPSRAALISGVVEKSVELVGTLRTLSCERWPSPPVRWR